MFPPEAWGRHGTLQFININLEPMSGLSTRQRDSICQINVKIFREFHIFQCQISQIPLSHDGISDLNMLGGHFLHGYGYMNYWLKY